MSAGSIMAYVYSKEEMEGKGVVLVMLSNHFWVGVPQQRLRLLPPSVPQEGMTAWTVAAQSLPGDFVKAERSRLVTVSALESL